MSALHRILKMKLKLYLSIPFIILLAVVTVVNWMDIAMIALGNALCIIAYASLIGIVDGEMKRIREEATSSNAVAVAESTPIDNMAVSETDFPSALTVERSTPNIPVV